MKASTKNRLEQIYGLLENLDDKIIKSVQTVIFPNVSVILKVRGTFKGISKTFNKEISKTYNINLFSEYEILIQILKENQKPPELYTFESFEESFSK